MKLITERLLLTEPTLENLADIHLLNSLPEVDRYNTAGIARHEEETLALLNTWICKQFEEPRTSYVFSILSKETGQLMGLVGLIAGKPHYRIAEIWYKLHPQFWGQGIATETVKNILQFAFHGLALHRIEAGCAVENIASIRVLEKAGMTREGRKREILPIRGVWTDNFFYSILEKEFESL